MTTAKKARGSLGVQSADQAMLGFLTVVVARNHGDGWGLEIFDDLKEIYEPELAHDPEALAAFRERLGAYERLWRKFRR